MSDTTVDVRLQLTAREVLTAAELPAAPDEISRTLTYGAFNGSARLTADTTPAIEMPPAGFSVTLGGGITTLDFTALALARDINNTNDYTGKKVVAAILKASAENAGAITIAPGATNPYPLYGASKAIIIGPGRMEAFSFIDIGSNLPAVSSTVKTVDLSGTSGDILEVFLLFGT